MALLCRICACDNQRLEQDNKISPPPCLNRRQLATTQVVAQHLFQEGRFAVGEAFLREAKLPYGEKLKAPFAAMHSVLQSVRSCPSRGGCLSCSA